MQRDRRTRVSHGGGTAHSDPPAAPASEVELSRAIVEQTSQGIWVIDAAQRTTFANNRMAELLGCTVENLFGRPISDFLDAASARAARAAGKRRRAGLAELREARLVREDGTTIDVLIEASPLTDDSGDFVGAVGMVTDITARKAVEREVSMLAALVQSSSDAIVACSLDGTVHSWNPAAEALFGWSAGEITGRGMSTILHAGDEGVLRLIESAAAGELVGPFEVDAVAKDRTRIPVELTGFPVDDGAGRVTMVAATLRDVRERREAERLMREVQRARVDIEKVGRLGVMDWLVDKGEGVWSDEVYRIHGHEPGSARIKANYMDWVHPDDRRELHDSTMAAMGAFEPLDLRYRIVLPGGDVRWVHVHAEPAPPSEKHGRRMAGTLRDVTELVRAEETVREARAELHRQALHDPLTSLPNRTLLIDRMSVALAQAERNRCGVAVIVADIDRFALVNQELGHGFADQLLKAVAQRLVGLMRAGDTVGRLSGDEFAIICESIEPHKQAVDTLAGRVVDAFGEPFAVGGREVYLASSAGAAWADDAEPAEALLGRATAALQGAKERERGSFVVALPGGAPYAGQGRLALRHALRDAIGDSQLRVVYQPIVSLDDAKPRALEALLRWDHPGLGPVSPLEFIPVAEDTGLILPIGEWVLNEACRTLASIDRSLSISVNLSPRQLMQQDLGAIVRQAISTAGIQPSRLVLELTESILVEESDHVGQTLAELKQIGVRLALDDFGTGYSALGYLKRFPFDIVKVDRSFVRGLGEDSGDSAIVGAILGMAGALGMEVVAEGIETEEQLACLTELGAKYGQGFFFARPGPAPTSG